MYGAIVGDIIGSRFEWHNYKGKDFKLFKNCCTFTDDTVMSIAVAEALSLFEDGIDNDEEFKECLIKSMHRIGNEYPHCGYGGRFYNWITQKSYKAYGSYGNGSAMRVSLVGFYAQTLAEAEHVAKLTAEVTHNHPEGIKGAVVTAGCIYLAREGKSKEEIREYIERYYNLDKTVDQIRPIYRFNETCQGSVPEALTCFLEAEDFEDCMRNCISIGGDSDTIAAIAGGVADAYFGVPSDILATAKSYLDPYLKNIIASSFHSIAKRNAASDRKLNEEELEELFRVPKEMLLVDDE